MKPTARPITSTPECDKKGKDEVEIARSRNSSTKKRLLIIALALTSASLAGSMLLTLIVGAHNTTLDERKDKVAESLLNGSADVNVPSQAKTGHIETEVVTIRRTGFEPAEIKRRDGHFLLAVYNRSGIGTMSLQVDRDTGGRLHSANVTKEKLDWKRELNLEPGHYLLTMVERPGWSCQFTIAP